MDYRRHNSCRWRLEALSKTCLRVSRQPRLLFSASHEPADMIFRLFITVLFFGFAILPGILGVMRGLYRSSIFQPPDVPDDSAAKGLLRRPSQNQGEGFAPARNGPVPCCSSCF
jgi:hypothetical protein